MRCPYCSYEESKVVDSRSAEDYNAIRRRRECLRCSKRYTTYEKVEDIPILVIKKDLSRESFNKEKIISGLIKACQKRPVSRAQICLLYTSLKYRLGWKWTFTFRYTWHRWWYCLQSDRRWSWQGIIIYCNEESFK